MNLQGTIDILATGTSEGAKKAWDTRGRGRKQQEPNWKAKAAKDSYVPSGEFKQRIAEGNEAALSSLLGWKSFGTKTNPFDLTDPSGKLGIELKTKFPDSTNPRINMKVEHRRRKGDHILKDKMRSAYTVALDCSQYGTRPVTVEALRSGEVSILVKSGVAAYRYNSMKRVSLTELGGILDKHKWVFPDKQRDHWGGFRAYIKDRPWESGEE